MQDFDERIDVVGVYLPEEEHLGRKRIVVLLPTCSKSASEEKIVIAGMRRDIRH